jgi:hypothetical protein
MVALVHAALLSLLVVWTPPPGRGRDPVLVQHIREHGRTYAEQSAYVRQLGAWMQREAETQHVPVWLVVALAHLESGMNEHPRDDADSVGIMQLNPKAPWGRAWAEECRLTPADCLQASVYWGVRALHDGYVQCGSWRRAVVFYRSGRCKAKRPVVERADRVMVLAADLAFEHGAVQP